MKLIFLTLLVTMVSCNANMNENNNDSIEETNTTFNQEDILKLVNDKIDFFKNNGRICYNLDSINPDFTQFYKKFITDSVFQINHVKFPINGMYEECEGESVEATINNWRFLNFDIRNDFYYDLDSNLFYQNEKLFYYESHRKEVGIIAVLGFEKIDDIWYLVLFQFNSC